MPSNNNSNKNSNKNSLSFGKGKNNMAMIGFFVIIICVAIAYYYIYQSNQEGFDDQNSVTPASGEVIVALFYAPWCGHCKTFKPIFQDAMTKLNGKTAKKSDISGKTIRLSMIDCDENPDIGKKYGISGYPTIKILKDDGKTIEYEGDRSLAGMNKFLVVDN